MNIVKARAAVEHIGKQLAQAMDAADNLAKKAHQAHLDAAQIAMDAETAIAEVQRLQAEFLAAETEFASCQTGLASTNGEAGGSAYNATIRTTPNPETT